MGSVFITRRGGGSGLNFNVVDGTSAPENPSENTIWVNTDTDITSWDFSAEEPPRRSKTKNLIPYPYYHTTRTVGGITFTDNGDGTVTANGTATANVIFRLAHDNTLAHLPAGTYTISGSPSVSGCSVFVTNNKTGTSLGSSKDGGSTSFSTTSDTVIRMGIQINSGTTVSNVVFKPQLEKGSAATSFVKGDATGQMWFKIGTESPVEFNALRRNAIQVYPLSAKQYMDGAWADKTAMSYQNGAWNSWIIYLFQNGDQNENVTGGWSSSIDDLDADGWTRGTYYAPSSDYPGGTEIGETLIVKIHGNTNLRPGSVAVGTRNTVDLTQYSKIKAVCNFTLHDSCTAAPTVRLAVHASLLTPCKTSYTAYVDIPQGASEVELDVSEISGLYHVILGGHTADDCPAYGGDLYISAVSIE